eukprot:COSAG06_NODE_8491_length_2153_cov_2.465920_2_plen_58_part_00
MFVPSLSWQNDLFFEFRRVHGKRRYDAFPINRSKQIQNRPKFPMKWIYFDRMIGNAS